MTSLHELVNAPQDAGADARHDPGFRFQVAVSQGNARHYKWEGPIEVTPEIWSN